MANAHTPGPPGFAPARARAEVTGRPPPRPAAAPLPVFSSAELISATEELQLLTGAFEFAMQSSNAKIDFARPRADPSTYQPEAYLRARDAWFGSSSAYQAYREVVARELAAMPGLRNRIDPNQKTRARHSNWQEAQEVFYAWTRRAYERKLGPGVNVPALLMARDSPRLKAALQRVSLRSGRQFTQGTFNPRPEKSPIGYRLGTISEHAFGNAIDIEPEHNSQLYAKEWAAIQSFTAAAKELGEPAFRRAQWRSRPRELHTAILELSREFSARLQRALDEYQLGSSSQERAIEALKGDTSLLAPIATPRLRAWTRGFFSLSWEVVGALHEAQFLWGATFKTPDLHHFELLPPGDSQ